MYDCCICVMIPHCIMYEGICILYLAQLAVVGRNSLYLLFIAAAVWPRTLNTAQTSPPPTDTTQPRQGIWNQFFVFHRKQRENNGVVTMDPKGVELHTAPASDKENKTKSFHPVGWGDGRLYLTEMWQNVALWSEVKWWYVRLYWYSYYGHFLLSSSISIYIHYSL